MSWEEFSFSASLLQRHFPLYIFIIIYQIFDEIKIIIIISSIIIIYQQMIADMTPVSEQPSHSRMKSRKEKNKLASRYLIHSRTILILQSFYSEPRTTVSQDVQTWFPVQLAFA